MFKYILVIVVFCFGSIVYADDVAGKYAKSCAICHASGVANAPKTNDASAWEPRLAKGMETLVGSVNKGLNAMPPKGMCFDCSDEETKALIEYMANSD